MSEFLFSIACTCISSETTGGSHVQVHSVPELLCRILAWLGSSYWIFRIMELSDVYVNDNELDKFHRIIAALTGLTKAWPARWRTVVPTYIQLCVNTCVIGIGPTSSNTTFWFVLDVPRISRNYFFSPDIFRATIIHYWL